jgi:hypothetical protein
MAKSLPGGTVLAYFFRKLTVFVASVSILIPPGIRSAYAVNFNVYTCYSGPTNSAVTSVDSNTIYTVAHGLNNAGTVVGQIELTNGHKQGYLFFGGACYLFDYPNASATSPNAIRDDGVIVGSWDDSAGHRHGFFFTGQWNSYDVPGSTATSIEGIGGDTGNVLIGQFATASETSGFYVVNGQAFRVVFPGAKTTNLTAITKDDVLLGNYTTSDDRTHGFYVARGAFQSFDAPNAEHTFAASINDPPNYQIVGFLQDQSSGKWHGFTLLNGKFTIFDEPLENSSNTLAQGINDNNTIVGQVTQPVVVGQSTKQLVEGWVFGTGGWPSASTGVIPAALPGNWLWQSNFPDGGMNQCTGAPTGYIYGAELLFAGNGAVQLQLDIKHEYTPDGCTPCEQVTVWNLGGTYAAYGPDLRMNNVRGQETNTDACNPASNFQTPSGPFNYDWLWIVSVESDGSLLDVQTQLGSHFDHMLLANPGHG